jgi:hypothetical protein
MILQLLLQPLLLQQLICGSYNYTYGKFIQRNSNCYLWSDGSTTNPTSAAPSSTTNYSCTITTAGCTKVTNTLVLNVNPIPSVPTSTPSSQCGVGIPAASVASTSGAGSPQFYWYSASSGGSLLQTPPVGPLQNYYSNNFTSSVLTNSSISGATAISGGVLLAADNNFNWRCISCKCKWNQFYIIPN